MALRQDVSARRFRTDTPRLTGWGSPALACALTHWFSRCCQSAGGSARRALSFSAACAARHWPAHSRSWPSGSRSDARRRPGACAGRGSSAAASAAMSRSKRASTSACAPRCAAYLRAGRKVIMVGHRRLMISLVTSGPVLTWLHAPGAEFWLGARRRLEPGGTARGRSHTVRKHDSSCDPRSDGAGSTPSRPYVRAAGACSRSRGAIRYSNQSSPVAA